MKKPQNYMSAKKSEPTELIECWRDTPKHQGTAWYRIADSHLSKTMLSAKPNYWICACDEHAPYSKLFGKETPKAGAIKHDGGEELRDI
jgi:hypothetical protein